MKFLNDMNVSLKLPVIIVVLSLITGGMTAVMSYSNARHSLTVESEEKLGAVLSGRVEVLQEWLHSIEIDIESQAVNPTVYHAIEEFTQAWAEIPGDKKTYLQDWYIQRNPNPTGSKENLDFASDGSRYSEVHEKYHPYLRHYLRDHGYYDVFLLDLDGNLIYSVFKELDYATNLMTGQWSQSDLGAAFRAARNSSSTEGHFFDLKPYGPSNGAAASFISLPVKSRSGELIGVLALQIPTDHISEITKKAMGLGETGQVYVVGEDHLMRSESRFTGAEVILQHEVETEAVAFALDGKNGVVEGHAYDGSPSIAAYESVNLLGVHWAVVAEQAKTELMQPAVDLRNKMAVQLAIAIVVISAIGFFFARTVANPMGALASAIKKIGDGDYDTNVNSTGRRDEIGVMETSLLSLRDSLKTAEEASRKHEEQSQATAAQQTLVVENLADGLKKLSDGDLTTRINIEFASDYEQLRVDFNGALTNLQEAMSTIAKTTGGITTGADEISKSSDDLSKRTEDQAGTLEETAAALDEITATVKQTSEGANEANSVADETRGGAQKSGDVVREAVEAMGQIEDSSKQISQIIGVIDDISFQTNLLALNAGVEAARAGDAGRGFAVVAQEVRALAQRSSDAAKEIKDLISASSQHVSTGVELVGKAGGSLDEIVGRVENVSNLVSEIAASAKEQSASLSEVNTAVNKMDKVTQQNAAMVEESTAASHSLTKDAGELTRLVSHFKTGVTESFVKSPVQAPTVAAQQNRVAAFAANGSAALKVENEHAADDWEEF